MPKREVSLDESDVSGGVDAARCDVVASVSSMVAGVAEEHARHGAWTELVGRGRGDVGVAEAAEHAKLVVAWRCAEEEVVRCQGTGCSTWAPVEEVRRRVQGLCPE